MSRGSLLNRMLWAKFELKKGRNRIKRRWLKRRLNLNHAKYYPFMIDYAARIAFPILIALFFFVYWQYVLSM